MRRLQCSGWCGRIFMHSDGMTVKDITRCQTLNKCPLCYNTTPKHTWHTTARPVPACPPTVIRELSDVKHRRKLYKKLHARRNTIPAWYVNECDEPYEDELDIEIEEGDDDECNVEEIEELSDDVEENEYLDAVGEFDVEIALEPTFDAAVADEDDEPNSEDADMCHDSESLVERWVAPCCIICGIGATGKFCRECSNYIRVQARRLLFYN